MDDNYETKIKDLEIAFLRGAERLEELLVFNLKNRLKDYKRRWKDHRIQDRLNKSRIIILHEICPAGNTG